MVQYYSRGIKGRSLGLLHPHSFYEWIPSPTSKCFREVLLPLHGSLLNLKSAWSLGTRKTPQQHVSKLQFQVNMTKAVTLWEVLKVCDVFPGTEAAGAGSSPDGVATIWATHEEVSLPLSYKDIGSLHDCKLSSIGRASRRRRLKGRTR